MFRSVRQLALILGASVASASAATSEPNALLGATKAIERLQAPAPAKSAQATDEIAALLQDLDRYAGSPGAPTAAAGTWVEFHSRWSKLRAKVDSNNMHHFDKTLRMPASSRSLMTRLPGPDSWPELSKRLKKEARQDSVGALDVLGAVLAKDAVGKAVERSKQKVGLLSQERRQAASRSLKTLERLAAAEDAPTLVKAFERELTERASLGGAASRLEVPDLVTLAGPERARELLGRALLLPSTAISVPVGDATQTLAQDLLIENRAKLRVPHWGLVRPPKAKAVYEALDRQFPEAAASAESPEDVMARQMSGDMEDKVDFGALHTEASARTDAQVYYMASLIVAKESEAAERLAMKLASGDALAKTGSALRHLRQQGHSGELYGFFKVLLEKNPTVAAWETYFELAAENGKTEEAVVVVTRALKNSALSSSGKRELKAQRAHALLAADKMQEATAEMESLLAASTGPEKGLHEFRTELALKLLEAGRLLDNPRLFERALKRARAELGAPWPEQERFSRGSLLLKVSKTLRDAGRFADAEAMVLRELEETQKNSANEMLSAFAMADESVRSLLVELAGIYGQAGHWQDVLTLADDAALWGADDLAVVAATKDSYKVPFGTMVGQALTARGDKVRARSILEYVIRAESGSDLAYEAYVAVTGEEGIPFLDSVYRGDRFEERPLIWKAVALVRAGKPDAAETVARQAIAVDPSDGEQGVGHRMRAYAILADALERRGQKESAEAYRGATRAIRISERADQFRLAGMHRRAIEIYREALTQFADAYCIQSRLAVELAHAGRNAEAEQHYRRAYELMPDSFGRVESHCFGCEKVFENQRAQSIAESVFAQLLKQTPEKAQVHYLMGYLRSEQGRHLEALENFRAAVAIDPEYLNAWKKLSETGKHMHVDRSERDLIALKMLSLDPQLRHALPELDEIVDLAALWRAVEAARRVVPAPAKDLYPLKASAARRAETLSKLPEAMRDAMGMSFMFMEDAMGDGRNKVQAPAVVISRTRLMGAVADLMDQ
jgi:tetratricopeptide (TPR) repeat protein